MPFRLRFGQIALPTAIERSFSEIFTRADQRHGNIKTVRDHYQAGIEDETKLIAQAQPHYRSDGATADGGEICGGIREAHPPQNRIGIAGAYYSTPFDTPVLDLTA